MSRILDARDLELLDELESAPFDPKTPTPPYCALVEELEMGVTTNVRTTLDRRTTVEKAD